MSRSFIAVDSNILIYAHNSDSEWHKQARDRLDGLAGGMAPWAIPWPCIHEFLAVTTNRAIFPGVDAFEMAVKEVQAWMGSPSLRLLGEMQGHWAELERVMKEGRIRGGAIHDARIAAICLEHGVSELWSADRDFSRVRRLRVRNPLIGASGE